MERLTVNEISLMLTKIRAAHGENDLKRVERLRHLAYTIFTFHAANWADENTAKLAKKLLECEQIGRTI